VHITAPKWYILIYRGLIDYFTYYIDMLDKIKWQLQTITVQLDTPFKFYPITVEFLYSGTSDSLALDRCSSNIGRFAVCNFRYRYWFHDLVLGCLDLTDPVELLFWLQQIQRQVNKVLLATGIIQLWFRYHHPIVFVKSVLIIGPE
jgi:hypothetical protein